MPETGPDLDHTRFIARTGTIGLVLSLLVALLVPSKGVQAVAQLVAIVTAWQIMFYGGTLLSNRLAGKHRAFLNVFLAVGFPLVASLYFLKDVQAFKLEALLGHVTDPWFLVVLVLIAGGAWRAADYIDRTHPFRGFLVAATAFWLISFMAHNGAYPKDPDGGSTMYVDNDAFIVARHSGAFFGQYAAYVLVCYGAMYLRLRATGPKSLRA